jgi:hypothetical protein
VRHSIVSALTCFFLYVITLSCVSISPTPTGIQAGHVATIPSKILAVPPFVMPNPVGKTVIEPQLLVFHQIQQNLEQQILLSFQGQKQVNGVSFNSVRNALSKEDKLLKEFEGEILNVSKLIKTGDNSQRKKFSNRCLMHLDFIDFYQHCLSENTKIQSFTQKLAGLAFNADAALFSFLFEAVQTKSNLEVQFSGAILLVDTNNAQLIWANYFSTTTPAQPKAESLNSLFAESLSQEFWKDFPGRLPHEKTQTPSIAI